MCSMKLTLSKYKLCLTNLFSVCSEQPTEIAEKPNLTWLDAAQVSVIYSSYVIVVLSLRFYISHLP